MIIRKIFSRIKSGLAIFELAFIRKRALSYQYNLIKDTSMPDSEILIENFFKTNFKKSALISYIVYPFLGKIETHHSNNRECYTIAEILNELEYNIDIINWDNTSFVPFKSYDLVIDNHNNLERLSDFFIENTKKIFHATNAHWLYQNSIEYKRYYDFFLKTGISISPPRLMQKGNSGAYCDFISMFGNEFTKNSYGELKVPVTQLPMSVTTNISRLVSRDYTNAKKNFLWLNSHGALLKGLDIVIDAFILMPDFNIHICGNFENDLTFMNAISEKLSQASNIKLEGWIDTDGSRFNQLVTDCAWVLNTSFSEGGGGSTLNCMAKGLIPIVSKSSSITLPKNTGYYLEQNNPADLISLVNSIQSLSVSSLNQMSNNAYEFILANHTLTNFKSKYKVFLKNVLQLSDDY